MADEQKKLINDLCADILKPVVIECFNDDLYNSKIDHDKKWIIDNFEAVLDKYILTLENFYNLDGDLQIDIEWEEVNEYDKNPSTRIIAEGMAEVKLEEINHKILAWAYARNLLSGEDFLISKNTLYYGEYSVDDVYIVESEIIKDIKDYKNQIIDELLERNDWEFLKEREVTGE
jgi:hypothetical protein